MLNVTILTEHMEGIYGNTMEYSRYPQDLINNIKNNSHWGSIDCLHCLKVNELSNNNALSSYVWKR